MIWLTYNKIGLKKLFQLFYKTKTTDSEIVQIIQSCAISNIKADYLKTIHYMI